MIKTLKQTTKEIYNWTKDKVVRFKNWLVILILGAVVVAAPLIPTIPDIALEKIQDKYEASELKDKYQLDGASLVKKEIKNAELDKYKKEPKDEIKITIGNKDLDKFTPDIELKRWNEVSFKLKPKGLDKIKDKDKSLKFDKDKIKFGTPDIDYEMYDYEEGYKYVWYLKKEPKTNIVEFDIEAIGLDFYYQPPLNIEMAGQECWTDACTETDCCDSHRPKNVVGSYAVYHQTKGGMVDSWGKDYKTGKMGMIYEPVLIDAVGNETRPEKFIVNSETGEYSITIPQDFLDNAVYPIKSNDTFGYTTLGVNGAQNADRVRLRIGSVTSNGTLDKVTFGVCNHTSYSGLGYAGGVYDSSLNVVDESGNLSNTDVGVCGSSGWVDRTLNSANISVATYYATFAFDSDGVNACQFAYDSGGVSGDSKYRTTADVTNPYSFPDPFSGSDSTNKYSIYCTYTAGGGAERRMFLTQ